MKPIEALIDLSQQHKISLTKEHRIECYETIEKALKRLEQLEEEKQSFDRQLEKKLKALEIIKETPIFAWYVEIYKNAYEMVADAKGFRVNNSVEELQQMFDLLKEVLEK